MLRLVRYRGTGCPPLLVARGTLFIIQGGLLATARLLEVCFRARVPIPFCLGQPGKALGYHYGFYI